MGCRAMYQIGLAGSWQYRLPAVAVLVVVACAAPQHVEAKEPLGRQWPAAQQESIDQVEFSQWNRLLQKYVDDDGYVNYSAWHRSRQDRQALQHVLAEFSRADPRREASTDAKLAYWINAYNAVTIAGILQEYPTSSIRNHTAKVFGYNIWKDLPLRVGNSQFTLDQMEHEVLRKMGEPRIHFAIVCASISCPRLRNEAYEPKTVRRQLHLNSVDFFSRSQNFRFDRRQRTIWLSSILDWFGDDFGNSRSRMLQTIRPYLPEAARPLADSPQTTVQFLDYNWNLNDQSRRTTRN